MIKLFRQTRNSLLTDGKFIKYLKYAIGEIILVVLGILIALQLNQKAENNKNNHTRVEYYFQLLEDLKKDTAFIQKTLSHFDSEKLEYERYLDMYNNTALSPDMIYQRLMSLHIMSTVISFNSNTIESLRSSGEIILFPLKIRNKLIDLLHLQDELVKYAQLNDTGKNNMLQDLGIYRGASTLNARLVNQPKLKTYLEVEKNLPKIILGLDAVHRWKQVSEDSSRRLLDLMLEEIEQLIDLIELEFEGNN